MSFFRLFGSFCIIALPFCAGVALPAPLDHTKASFVKIGQSPSYIFSVRNNALEHIDLEKEKGLATVVEVYNKNANKFSYNIFHIKESSCQKGRGTALLVALGSDVKTQMEFTLGQKDAISLVAQVICLTNDKEKMLKNRGDHRPDAKLNIQ